ncbi:MAG: lysophospholipase L1-like esterase/pimeloyl-ACP methyl ester carboxylesterase [Planctomycetota bacterium]
MSARHNQAHWLQLLWACVATLVATGSALAQTIVCIGDSITQGQSNVEQSVAWPTLLGSRISSDTRVVNLGVGGATLLRDTDQPYLGTKRWLDAPELQADVVIVILGTNDSVLQESRRCWDAVEHLQRDLDAMLAAIGKRYEGARVLLCSPPPVFPKKGGLKEARAADLSERAPRLTQLAQAYRTEAEERTFVDYVDLSRVMNAGQVTDGVHPNPFGAASIADHLAAILRTPQDPSGIDIVTRIGTVTSDSQLSEYHGFPKLDFVLAGSSEAYSVVRPHRVAAGRPWIWRARFFGHEPSLDLALLERGFHLVYCDVSNLYGSKQAMERWERAYQLFHVLLEFSEQPILHGLSRGGLPVLNFAIRNPERPAALVLDNAVCDFRSWPGGRNGKRSDADWTRLLNAYDLSDEQALSFEAGPLSQLDALAKAQLPMIVLMGTADVVVPPDENGERVVTRYEELNGPLDVWRKPGLGHHPHGLHPVAPLARTLLRITGIDEFNPAAHPVASVEYRGAPAGWGAGSSWAHQVESMRALAQDNPDIELVFFGDSITQGLTGSSQRLTQTGGKRAIDRFEHAISLGLSGDRTEHLLYRIKHGALAVIDPKVIVIQIGVNNLNSAGHTGHEVAEGMRALVTRLRRAEPQAELILCGPFPAGKSADHPMRAAIDTIHTTNAELGRVTGIHYLDLRPLFVDEDGQPNDCMRGDAIHISGAGQEAWMAAIDEFMSATSER